MALLSNSSLERASVQATALANLIDGLALETTDPALITILTDQSTKARAMARVLLKESLRLRKSDLDTRVSALTTEAAAVADQIRTL